jgi:hypothetical protein
MKSNNSRIREILHYCAEKQISIQEAGELLTEAAAPTFSSGEKVYIAHGISAGTYGNFKGNNGNYCTIDAGPAGLLNNIPIVFVQKTNQ